MEKEQTIRPCTERPSFDRKTKDEQAVEATASK